MEGLGNDEDVSDAGGAIATQIGCADTAALGVDYCISRMLSPLLEGLAIVRIWNSSKRSVISV